MDRTKRLRRVLILGIHCIRNLTYYRYGWHYRKPLFNSPIVRQINSNFLDICLLEWCKLFGDTRGKHYWRNVVTDPTHFECELLKALGCSAAEFEALIEEVRTYRDKFIAHLDSDETMNIPKLDFVRSSAEVYYKYVLRNELAEVAPDIPPALGPLIDEWKAEAKRLYSKIK